VGPEGQNNFMRPNQLLSCALMYSPIDDETKAKILKSIKSELLTTRGIRTLSPKNPLYKGEYDGVKEGMKSLMCILFACSLFSSRSKIKATAVL